MMAKEENSASLVEKIGILENVVPEIYRRIENLMNALCPPLTCADGDYEKERGPLTFEDRLDLLLDKVTSAKNVAMEFRKTIHGENDNEKEPKVIKDENLKSKSAKDYIEQIEVEMQKIECCLYETYVRDIYGTDESLPVNSDSIITDPMPIMLRLDSILGMAHNIHAVLSKLETVVIGESEGNKTERIK